MSKVLKTAKSAFLGGAEKTAGKQLEAGFQASGATFAGAGKEGRALFQPFVGPGQGAFDIQSALSGALGVGAEQRALTDFQESPGQRFLRERGEQTLLRNAAAIGGIGGGNVRKALTEFGIGTAAQDLQNRFNRLGTITNVGQNALANQQQAIQFGATGLAQGQVGVAQAQAQGTLGEAAAIRQTVTQGAQLAAFSDPILKENIKRIGTLPNGLGWYGWDWRTEALDIVGEQKAQNQGVMADEVEVLLPEAVFINKGYRMVDYGRVLNG